VDGGLVALIYLIQRGLGGFLLHGANRNKEASVHMPGLSEIFSSSFFFKHERKESKTYLLSATFVKGTNRVVEVLYRDSHGLSETRLATRGSKTKGGGRKV